MKNTLLIIKNQLFQGNFAFSIKLFKSPQGQRSTMAWLPALKYEGQVGREHIVRAE